MDAFEYNSHPGRVVFGHGTVKRLPDELKRLNLSSPLLLSTPQQVEQIQSLATTLDHIAGTFTEATMHTPVPITQRAVELASTLKADSVISLGGGSTIGLGKAISIRTGLPHICVPTTYAGSDQTPILGETQDGRKTTRSDPKILPAAVIYDVDLTLTLPAHLSATSGVNAIAHAVEALYARNTNPVTDLLALEGVKALAGALPAIVAEPSDREARSKALYGAWLCGICLGNVGMALHHKLCHALGGTFNLPHAETHTIVLPHALAYNAPRIEGQMKRLAEVLPGSEGDAIRGLNVLLGRLRVKRALKEFGMKEEDVDSAADVATEKPYWNPREVERDKLKEVIRSCWAGEDARADL